MPQVLQQEMADSKGWEPEESIGQQTAASASCPPGPAWGPGPHR